MIRILDGRVLLKRIPNAEHELIGHQLNELYTLMGFFLSTYEVNELYVNKQKNINHYYYIIST